MIYGYDNMAWKYGDNMVIICVYDICLPIRYGYDML